MEADPLPEARGASGMADSKQDQLPNHWCVASTTIEEHLDSRAPMFMTDAAYRPINL